MRFLRRQHILHRALAVALCLAVALSAAAQRTRRKAKGPRALALVEWPARGGSPRVIPVTILVDGRYYDASIYKADPVPMALEPGNVYEVEQSGESLGLVTLTGARQAKNGAWLADAKFQTNEQLAAARRPREAAPQSPSQPEGPPRLRRGGEPSETPQTSSAPQPPSAPPGSGDQPPVLRKPAGPAAEPQQEDSSHTASPTTHQTKAGQPEPDHPVLRRGRPTAEQAENLPGAVEPKAAPKPPAAAAGPVSPATKAAAAAPGRVLPAISDADGPEPRSFLLPWKSEDQDKVKPGMIQLASAALQEWARTHGGTHPGALQDAQVRVFDLSASNEPQIVLMARAAEAPPAPGRRALPAPSGLTYWITVVARQNYDGALRKLKAWATDSKHLDAYPRAELIDAVDAQGDGRGELLFREIFDDGQSFALYRVTPDTLTELYNSAALEH